jgi:hypothetical protein
MKKMKRTIHSAISTLAFLIISSLLIYSCKDDDESISAEDLQTFDYESVEESNTDEIDNMAEVALAAYDAANGRIRKTEDQRFDCDGTTVTFTNVSDDKSSGKATINFGAGGCTDAKGNIRKGTIIIQWAGGRWFREGSIRTITFDNYSINGLGIEGTRILTCTGAAGTLAEFTITWDVAADHTLTWPDGATATRAINKTKQWSHTSAEDTYTVSNGPALGGSFAVSGMNRNGEGYSVNLTTPLVYKASCIRENKAFLAVSGVKVVTNSMTGKTLTIDYGNGTCDNSIVLTVDGISKTVEGRN